ncbi:ribonuclease H-like domain-containing protein [Tanacetum coccineum]
MCYDGDSVTKKADTTTNVFQDLNHINLFDIEYPWVPNIDERVDHSLNSDYKSQSDSSHSSVPGEGMTTNDFPSVNLRMMLKAMMTSLPHRMSWYSKLKELNENIEPKSFFKASKFAHWTDAMNNEMDALLRNDTLENTELPKDRKAIGSKWVFKINYNSDGEIERYKARIFAKGFNKKEGVDFEQTFSPVVKMVTARPIWQNDAQSNDDIFAAQDEQVTTLEDNIIFEGNVDQNPSTSTLGTQNLRRSSRPTVFPRNYNDFVIDSKVNEPKSFFKASKFAHWTDAMNNEMDALLRNDTL